MRQGVCFLYWREAKYRPSYTGFAAEKIAEEWPSNSNPRMFRPVTHDGETIVLSIALAIPLPHISG
jgi:hypothetical protein